MFVVDKTDKEIELEMIKQYVEKQTEKNKQRLYWYNKTKNK